MKSLNSYLHKFSRAQNSNNLIIPCHLNHSLAQSIPPWLITGESRESVDPKTVTTQLSNCTNLKQLNQFHAHIIRTRFLELYPFSFHYNVVIRSYTRLDSPVKALHVYVAMSRVGVTPDEYTIPIVLKAASQNLDYVLGKQIHGISMKCGLETNMHCESGFISLYFKAGKVEDALKVFEKNTDRKLGSWNAVIGGLSQDGRAKEAIRMFMEMVKNGIQPDDITMVSLTSACGSLGDLNLALQLHKCVFQAKSLEKSDILMMNSLIDMYGKCGRMDLASKVFTRMEVKNVSSWTSMIVGYASHGHVGEALECFCRMREFEVRPNHVTFVGVLTACVHGGTVKDGNYYFDMMKNVYGIMPMLQHYGCMVDLLGRAGMLDKAKEMVENMPMKANVVIWGCLMGACEKYGNVKMGEWVAKHLIELEPWNDGVYVVLSNIYASNGMWKEVEGIRDIMKNRKLAKLPAYSLPGVESGNH
ncbi:Pentatricopeptide repeat-containing protein [Forsythia ovata]|uniref:Pentatricopeptide repeat-containing protein n=1 Tax=Forsythia ovata TaxID=205694 RepID=A0ABD1X2Q8_9LAMI